MIRYEPGHRSHLADLQSQESEEVARNIQLSLDSEEAIHYLNEFTRTLVLEDTDTILGMTGVTIIRPGVGEVWASFREIPSGEKRNFVKALVAIKEECFEILALWRVQMAVRQEFAAGAKLMDFLGMKYEATLDSYYEPWALCDLYVEVRK